MATNITYMLCNPCVRHPVRSQRAIHRLVLLTHLKADDGNRQLRYVT